jgi:murein L,D-transpeptidase YcbB/YkuD
VSPDVYWALGPGDTGDEVAEMQSRLGLECTGVFDEVLTQRVRGVQMLHGLIPDGIIDEETVVYL